MLSTNCQKASGVRIWAKCCSKPLGWCNSQIDGVIHDVTPVIVRPKEQKPVDVRVGLGRWRG